MHPAIRVRLFSTATIVAAGAGLLAAPRQAVAHSSVQDCDDMFDFYCQDFGYSFDQVNAWADEEASENGQKCGYCEVDCDIAENGTDIGGESCGPNEGAEYYCDFWQPDCG
jgi:hypothetical protein